MSRPLEQPLLSVPSTRTRKRLRARNWPHPPKRDPHVRVIAQLVELAGPDASIVASSSRPWASATFIGAQHRIVLRMIGENAATSAARFADMLPEAELAISGHIVADACIDETVYVATGEEDAIVAAEASECSNASAVANGPGILVSLTVLTVENW